MSLKSYFLFITVTLMGLFWLAIWFVSQSIIERIIEQWGLRIAEIQVHYDSTRLLRPLEREIALARQMAESKTIKRWIVDPDVPSLRVQALEEMESYRRNFLDQSYFLAVLDTGAYYHNNAANEFAGRQLRYHLDPANPADAWFYQLIAEGREFHLNVNPDEELGVTKLWIDVLIQDGERILGIAGTGLALAPLLEDIVDLEQPGITTLFLDYHGAIQLYRDPRYIDFGSLIKPEGQKNTIGLLLDRDDDRSRVQDIMRRLVTEAGNDRSPVHTDFVNIDGKRQLLGIAYLPSIGWYEVTLLDLETLLPIRSFLPIGALFLLTLLAALLIFHQLLNRLILSPLAALNEAMRAVRDGKKAYSLPRGRGEMGNLIKHFDSMADAIVTHTSELEDRIRKRTEELDRLTRIDPLTGLLNRRGMTDILAGETARSRRVQSAYGLIWLDIDGFKSINDQYGHAVGDQVLVTVADLLGNGTRIYDHVSRWGGDEFLAVLSPCDPSTLQTISERLRGDIEQQSGSSGGPHITVSIGACLAMADANMDHVLKRADDALYRAKAAGRNTVEICESP